MGLHVVDYATLGSSPVSEGDPCGEAVRYDSDFEALEAEVGKQEALSGGAVDWPRVVQLANGILESKSKDLLVAAYLTRGLLETDGYRGLASGLQVMNDMLEAYWEGLFPPLKRARARASAVQWMAEQVAPKLDVEPSADNAEHILAAEKLLRGVDGTLAEKLGDAAPALTELSRPLRDMKRAAEHLKQQAEQPPPAAPAAAAPAPEPAAAGAAETAAAPTPEPAQAPSPPAAPAPAPAAPKAPAPETAAAPASVESEADVKKALRAVQDTFRKLAAFQLQARLSDPRAYRLARIATWLLIDQAPPNKDGATQLNPPPADKRKQLQAKFEAKQYSELLPELEQTLMRAGFWLDGQRLAAGALREMGGEYAAAFDVVVGEFGQFVRRVPAVADLSFADGTPFADDQTRLWLRDEVLAAPQGEGGGDGGEAQPWVEAAAAARADLVKGDAGKAVKHFEAGLSGAASARERFCWRLALAELMVRAGRVEVAIPILEAAEGELERHAIGEWEPALAASLYRTLGAAYRKAGNDESDPDLAARRARTHARLCSIDPISAIQAQED